MSISDGNHSLKWCEPVYYPQLLELMHACFPAQKWTGLDLDRFQDKAGQTNVIKVLVDERDAVYGAVFYTLLAGRTTCRIRRLAVHADYRRQGLGSFMLSALCGERSPVRRKHFVARVPEDRTDALMFFTRGAGFRFDPDREREVVKGEEMYEFTFEKHDVRLVRIADY